ncbi:MAG: glutathione S-transferase N-terminal domain-containing protein [Alphaproteobacteria bacterium]|nr:glutathione S-transferase N-terminal domain-containing protein [Alphaproteobacteria bacterium]
MKNEQFAPSFLKIDPNNKIPALLDAGFSVFESGAILIYLAKKHQQFWASDSAERIKPLRWMFFQAGSQGPMLGQAHYNFGNSRTKKSIMGSSVTVKKPIGFTA